MKVTGISLFRAVCSKIVKFIYCKLMKTEQERWCMGACMWQYQASEIKVLGI